MVVTQYEADKHSRRTMSLSSWLASAFIIFSLILIVGVCSLVYFRVGKTLHSLQSEYVEHEVREISLVIDSFVNNCKIILQDYASQSIISQGVTDPPGKPSEKLASFMKNMSILGIKSSFALMNSSGKVIASSCEYHCKYSAQPWFADMIDDKRSTYAGVITVNNKSYWQFASSVKHDNRIMGVIASEIPIMAIEDNSDITARLEGYSLELIVKGKTVASFGEPNLAPPEVILLKSLKMALRYRWDKSILEKKRQELVVSILIGLIFLLVLLMISAFIASNLFFARPLKAFRKFTRSLAQHKKNTYAPENQRIEELRLLATDFNAMAGQIDSRENALRQARDHLEEVVEERTKELKHELKERKKTESALKESETRFRHVAESAGEYIWEMDRDGNFIFLTDRVSEILGYKVSDMLGKSFMDYVYDPDKEFVKNSLKKYCDNRETFNNLEFRSITGDGKIIWQSVNGLPMSDRKQTNIGYRGAGMNITSRKTSEESLKKAREDLEIRVKERTAELQKANGELQNTLQDLSDAQGMLLQSEKMASVGQLAAGVAHEINNPTGFVASNLVSLKEYMADFDRILEQYESLRDMLNEELDIDKEFIDGLNHLIDEIDLEYLRKDITSIIDDSCEGMKRISRIVSDLKDFSHVDKNEVEEVDINHAIDKVISVAWNELKYKAKIHKNYGDIPLVQCFGGQISQVFMNLLVNAAQAMESEGQINISTEIDESEGNVIITIADNGKGIPQEIIDKIFDPFFTTKPVGKGTGLGLNIVYNIIKAHKGVINVESQLDEGTTFIIKLPILFSSSE